MRPGKQMVGIEQSSQNPSGRVISRGGGRAGEDSQQSMVAWSPRRTGLKERGLHHRYVLTRVS